MHAKVSVQRAAALRGVRSVGGGRAARGSRGGAASGDAGGVPGADAPRGKCDSPEQEAYLHMWRTYDLLKALEEQVFDRHDLSAQQYNALRILADAAPDALPTLALAGRLVSRAPDITRLLDRLERRHLIRRDRRADNRRVVAVSITRAGTALLDELADEIVACGHRQLGHMKPSDLRLLVDLLRAARAPHERERPGDA
ncbi:MAG: MarR family transcriptional regulator [Planctomycetes bacterium]|nr:MarR family transcriptional regulator [Planctomycetota bacterium]